MFNFDDHYDLLQVKDQKESHNILFDEKSEDEHSRKISLMGFDSQRSQRQSVSLKNPSNRESVPMTMGLNHSLFLPNDDTPPKRIFKEDENSRYSKTIPESLKTRESVIKEFSPKLKQQLKHPPEPIVKFSKRIRKEKITKINEREFTLKLKLPNVPPPQAPVQGKPNKKKNKKLANKTRCTCAKTKCLKLYCECFAKNGFCNPKCRCTDCHNKESLNDLRELIIQETIEKNPLAFASKFKNIEEKNIKKLHSRGCNCKKTGCVKNYCECFHANIGCSQLCKCEGCQNEHLEVKFDELVPYRDKVLRKRKRRNYLYDFYFQKVGSKNE